jgi:uncharacterized protein YdeI (YjbR/CyaY-like superfamily)
MATKDPRIDAYIDKSADFAKPILDHLRALVHKACPDAVETIKWSFPNFDYKGSILCSMASFKQHCAFGFWLGAVMKDAEGVFIKGEDKSAMGQLGQIKSLKDLPSDKVLIAYLKEAASLIDQGVKLPKKEKATNASAIEVPGYFSAYLKKNKPAFEQFNKFPPSHRKEYIQWITEAKTEATREKRMATAIEWIAEGKSRNWKYER